MKIKSFGLAVVMALALAGLPGVASASPGVFTAEKYPATVSANIGPESFGHLSTHWGTAKCPSPVLAGNMTKPTETLTLTATLSENCKFAANKCEFSFHPESESANGTFDIGGVSCSSFTVSVGVCLVTVFTKKGLPATFQNKGTGSSATIEIDAEAEGLAHSSSNCGPKETVFNDASYDTTWTVKGQSEGSSAGISVAPFPGASIIGEGEGARFHSDLYPSIISGEQVEGTVEGVPYAKIVLRTWPGANLTCKTATFVTPSFFFPEGLTEDVEDLILAPTYGGCTFAGINATVTPEAGCFYDFNVAGPQAGNLGLCAIEIKPTSTACVVIVGGQTRPGLKFFNVGSGSSAKVEAKANVSGVSYQIVDGTKCPGKPASGSYSDGKYGGVVLLKVAKIG